MLRDIVRYQGPPTLIVSRHSREEEIVEALAIGAVDFLPKPFRSNELLARIRTRLVQPAQEPPSIVPPVSPTPSARRLSPAEEEPVFMGHADEHTLITPPVQQVASEYPEDDHLALGARLHSARQRRRLSLVQVNLETRIPVPYLQAIEEEKFSLLPRGQPSAQMVQTYATYLGLDTARALAEYRGQYDTTPFKPIPSLGGAPAPRTIPTWIGVVVALILALAIGLGGLWYLAGDKLPILRSNLRGLVARPTATGTPAPTAPPTVTPRPTNAVPTRTPASGGALPIVTPAPESLTAGPSP